MWCTRNEGKYVMLYNGKKKLGLKLVEICTGNILTLVDIKDLLISRHFEIFSIFVINIFKHRKKTDILLYSGIEENDV